MTFKYPFQLKLFYENPKCSPIDDVINGALYSRYSLAFTLSQTEEKKQIEGMFCF